MTATADVAIKQQAVASRPLVASIRRLIITMGVGLFIASLCLTASRSGGEGGVNGDGEWIDSTGAVVEDTPMEYAMTLQPTWLSVVVAVGVLLWALGRISRSTKSDAELSRFLARIEQVFIIVLILGVIYAQILFWITPLEGWGANGGTWIFPFPFAEFDITVEPMQ